MKNSFGEYQNVLVLGSNSDIANAILKKLHISPDAKIVRLGISEMADYILDLNAKFDEQVIENSFNGADIDLFILASGMLGSIAPESSVSQMVEQCNINFTNSIAALKTVSEKMLWQGHGSILVISSVASLRPRQENYIYGATKAGLDFYARGLSDYLHNSGVNVCIVRPGFVVTKMTKRLGNRPFSITPEHVALLSVKGLSKSKSLVYAPSVLKYLFIIVRILPKRIFLKLK
ncbi:decaprenylphospho-beta-D-erythro-pentofuranosid-2-ulose 2-reductase [Candidatus Planktophila lacus]|uniref:SDR family NAD(P)-dependent oxidoreductase n=1 Tax=Candidatus Planktophila lacus TaxID=1884913 RepID=UPI000BAC8B1C|nr:SDR family NAD(P)-dependent oxidoreductase [Candidatus Planktophila lacus]ASY24505.1 decaprenylphospho-beta-D-erythro-pentofuranosid-2-ulose 2-reductase [Candidatus Planktophila lacus]